VRASVTRHGTNRIGGKDRRADPSPAAAVAVVAASDREAKAAASALRERIPDSPIAPASLAAYLASPGAPSRVILCATRASAADGLAFLGRAAVRLLWPAPPADIDAAIGGLRDPASERSGLRARRPGRPRAALLLEGPVDQARARAALAAVAEAGPRDWVVESARHVRLREHGLAALARAGIRWSALEPAELLAVYAARPVARALRRRPWLPRGTPVWIKPGRNPR
jgi:hypothetical protein